MPDPVLRTRLYRPTVPSDLVRRQRLHERIDAGLRSKVTLVSAPAGYGKSMLVSHWVEGCEEPCAWLSLTESDGDLTAFTMYLLAAIRTVNAEACPETEALSRTPNPTSVPLLGGCLVNELDSLDSKFVLALDDYHRIEPASDVHDLVRFILDHPPRSLHLVIMTRRDPPLPLASLRGKGEVTDIRLEDLRFTEAEIAAFYHETANLELRADVLTNLQRQTEGWAVALRLVSLHVSQLEDPAAFLREFHGGIPSTQEYLMQEVIDRRSPEMQNWLLKSSVLDRFCPDLCDAVCAAENQYGPADLDGRQFVDALQRCNIFAIGLDVQGEWFQYHHLFQELLFGQLKRCSDPDQIAALHARASKWLENHAFIEEAISHALAAGNPTGAAEIAERHRRAELDEDRWFIVKRWLDLLPAEIKQQRVGLLLTQAWVAYYRYQMADLFAIVEQLERLGTDQALDPISLAELNFFRGVTLYWAGRGPDSQQCCEDALAQYSEKPGLAAGEVRVYLALARCMTGAGELALEHLEEEIRADTSASDMFTSRLHGAQTCVHLLSADLTPTVLSSQRVITVAERFRSVYAQAWGHYPQALAHLHFLRLDEALRGFLWLAEQWNFFEPKVAVDALAGLVLTYQFLHKPDRAANAAQELIALAQELREPEFNTVAESCRARLSLLQEDLKPAAVWANSADLEPDAAGMFFWLEDPVLTQIRVQIAAGTDASLRTALESLAVLRPQIEAVHLAYQMIDTLVLQSLALEKSGRTDEALVTMEAAVILGEPRGWVRPYIEPGPSAVQLLNRLRERERCAAQVGRILTAVGETETAANVSARARLGGLPLVEPLTVREQEVLELLAGRLRDKEIAQRLYISPQTVNFHCKHIYQKFGVSNRQQAVAAAVDLEIIERS